MTEAAQEGISAITEIYEIHFADHVRALMRAVLSAALAGGVPYMVFTVPISASTEALAHLPLALCVALLPVIVAGVTTLIAALFLGLPLTALLRRSNNETRRLYSLCGAFLGFIIPLGAVLAASGSWEPAIFLALPGTLAGAAAGLSWGSWRRQIANSQGQRKQRSTSFKRTNPIHDFIH